MRRGAAGILTLAIALAAARSARAQTFYLGNAATDTAVGLVVGTELQIPIRGAGLYGYPNKLQSVRLTFFYDPALVDILGAVPDGLSIADSLTGSGSFMVSASGCTYGTDVQVLQLRVRLKPGATNGAYLWSRVDNVVDGYYCGDSPLINATSAIAQLCTATQVYGDVDGNAKVESRDALITLSAAVGLPVTGFNLGLGDVDGDGLANSRDALMMLSYAIGLPVYSTNRIAQGIPTNCPPLVVPGEQVVFRRPGNGVTDTLFSLAAAATVGVPIPNTTGVLANPRLAADGVSIVFGCLDPVYNYYNHICRINADGTGLLDLTPDPNHNEGPDWSPDGTKIAFLWHGCYPYTMDMAGTNLVRLSTLPGGYCSGPSIAWSRSGTRLVYPANGLWIVNSDGTGDAPLTTGFSDQYIIRWSPAGESLAFTRSGDGLYVVPAAGGPADRVLTLAGLNHTNGFDWGPHGFLFSLSAPGRSGIWLLPSLTGPIYRVTGGNDRQPSFRRTP
jgi:hypothetical protein